MEVLDKSEIDRILEEASGGSYECGCAGDASGNDSPSTDAKKTVFDSDGGEMPLEAYKENRRRRYYDFKRPERFSKAFIKHMENVFEGVAKKEATDLSNIFDRAVQVRLVYVDQLTYEEYFRTVPVPSFFGIVDKNETSYVCNINLDILKEVFKDSDEMIKKSFERDGRIPFLYDHTVYDFIFQKLNDLVWEQFYAEVSKIKSKKIEGECWVDIVDNFHGSYTPLSTNILPDETCLLVMLTAKIGEAESDICFCLPYSFVKENLHPLGLCTRYERSPFARTRLPGNGAVPLGWCNIADENRHLLKIGEVITFAQMVTEPLPLMLSASGLVFAEGEVITFDESYALEITKVFADPKDPNVTTHYGDYGLNVLPGNVYARLGQFQIHDESKVREGDMVVLDTVTSDLVDLVERESGIVLARGDLFINDWAFAVKITEVL